MYSYQIIGIAIPTTSTYIPFPTKSVILTKQPSNVNILFPFPSHKTRFPLLLTTKAPLLRGDVSGNSCSSRPMVFAGLYLSGRWEVAFDSRDLPPKYFLRPLYCRRSMYYLVNEVGRWLSLHKATGCRPWDATSSFDI